MDIKISTQQGRVPITVLNIEGDIDSSTYEDLLAKARAIIKEGARYIVIDLSRAPYVSSAGLRTIHTIFHDLRAAHPEEGLSEEQMERAVKAGTYKSPHLKLLNLSSGVKGVFEIGGFGRYIETFDDLQTAIASF